MVVFSLTECSEKSGIKQIYCLFDPTGFSGYGCIGCRVYSGGAFARTCRCLNKPRCTLAGDRLTSGLWLNNLPCHNIWPGHRPAVRLWRPRNASESALVDKIVSTQKRHKPTTINPTIVFKNKMWCAHLDSEQQIKFSNPTQMAAP